MATQKDISLLRYKEKLITDGITSRVYHKRNGKSWLDQPIWNELEKGDFFVIQQPWMIAISTAKAYCADRGAVHLPRRQFVPLQVGERLHIVRVK